ncbi:MAG: radical SAM protein, partial [Candidatus Eremiobacteraeota bacterium]|nr:radical SAM protein [Candidatus Eremiobacteraeota bacterium]
MHPAVTAARRALLADRRPLVREELLALTEVEGEQLHALLELASDVRDHYCGARAYVEVIYNAKKGGCSEDCHFCSQSARFATDVAPEPLKTVDEFVAAARAALERGAGEFCIVVAVRGPSQALLTRVAEAVRAIKATMPLEVAVSLGILSEAHLAVLAAAGVDKVNHNLESSRSFFPSGCTTHTYDERWETCRRVK